MVYYSFTECTSTARKLTPHVTRVLNTFCLRAGQLRRQGCGLVFSIAGSLPRTRTRAKVSSARRRRRHSWRQVPAPHRRHVRMTSRAVRVLATASVRVNHQASSCVKTWNLPGW